MWFSQARQHSRRQPVTTGRTWPAPVLEACRHFRRNAFSRSKTRMQRLFRAVPNPGFAELRLVAYVEGAHLGRRRSNVIALDKGSRARLHVLGENVGPYAPFANHLSPVHGGASNGSRTGRLACLSKGTPPRARRE